MEELLIVVRVGRFDCDSILEKNWFFWSKNRWFKFILCYSIFIKTDSSSSESELEWTSYSAIRNFENDDLFFSLGTRFFSKNRMKMLLEISGNFSKNFYNSFFQKTV